MIFNFVNSQPPELATDSMGSIAAAMQIVSLSGQIYEIVCLFKQLK